MSGKKEKTKRQSDKIKATRFANYLDEMEVNLWLKYKQTNQSAKCNAEFQAKIDKALISPDSNTVL